MPDLSTLAPVVFATLTPYEGHVEDVKREFAALAQSVWDNEATTRCYYWLYPEDDPASMLVIEIYDGEKGIDVHACGDLTFDTFDRTHQYGIRIDMDGLRRRKAGLPPQAPAPDVEERGLVCDYLQPVKGVKAFMGTPDLDEDQVLRIAYFNAPEDKRAGIVDLLKKYAEVAKSSGKIETFWVIHDIEAPEKFRLITRFKSRAQDLEFYKLEEVKESKNKLAELADSLNEQNHKWAKQGFFLKQ